MTVRPAKEISSPFDPWLSRSVVALYRGWHRLEQEGGGPAIIDFDLADADEPASLNSRSEVLSGLRGLLESLGENPSDDSLELLKARLAASITFLEALSGAHFKFRDYIRALLLIEPTYFPQGAISAQREVIQQLLGHVGLEFTRHAYDRFKESFEIRSREAITAEFQKYRAKWLPELMRHLKVEIRDYSIEEAFVVEDAYWRNWISGDLAAREMLVRINVHPRQPWVAGAPENLVLHEYCGHAVQMILWHQRIRKRQLPQFLGILTVHFPDQFTIEGLGESLPYLLPDTKKLEPEAEILREINYYNLLVWNNAHIIANQDDEARAVKYAAENLPFTTDQTIRSEIENRTKNVVFRAYQYVYGAAKHSFLHVLQPLGTRERWQFAREIFCNPMTAKHFVLRAQRYLGSAPLAVQPVENRPDPHWPNNQQKGPRSN